MDHIDMLINQAVMQGAMFGQSTVWSVKNEGVPISSNEGKMIADKMAEALVQSFRNSLVNWINDSCQSDERYDLPEAPQDKAANE